MFKKIILSFLALSSLMAFVVPNTALAANIKLEKNLNSKQCFDSRPTILDITNQSGFTSLAYAVEKSGLTDALKGKRKLTVFAPTNEAFSLLANNLGYENAVQMVDDLQQNNPELLKNVLLYHITPRSRYAKSVARTPRILMLNGQYTNVSVESGQVKIDGANIIATDIKASNGVVHVIDAVIMPN